MSVKPQRGETIQRFRAKQVRLVVLLQRLILRSLRRTGAIPRKARVQMLRDHGE